MGYHRGELTHWKDILEDIWDDICSPFRRIRNTYRSITNGLLNIIAYIPAVWDDYDFESHSLYRLIYYKLKLQQEFFESDRPWCVGAKSRARRIRLAKCLAQRLWEDEYSINASVLHDMIYKYDNFFESKAIYDEEGRVKYYTSLRTSTDEESKSFKKYMEHAMYMKKQDKDLLFNILNKYLDDWWD